MFAAFAAVFTILVMPTTAVPVRLFSQRGTAK
jgi:hypothetical protein